jgi:hypothetical protein
LGSSKFIEPFVPNGDAVRISRSLVGEVGKTLRQKYCSSNHHEREFERRPWRSCVWQNQLQKFPNSTRSHSFNDSTEHREMLRATRLLGGEIAEFIFGLDFRTYCPGISSRGMSSGAPFPQFTNAVS